MLPGLLFLRLFAAESKAVKLLHLCPVLLVNAPFPYLRRRIETVAPGSDMGVKKCAVKHGQAGLRGDKHLDLSHTGAGVRLSSINLSAWAQSNRSIVTFSPFSFTRRTRSPPSTSPAFSRANKDYDKILISSAFFSCAAANRRDGRQHSTAISINRAVAAKLMGNAAMMVWKEGACGNTQ